MKKLSIYSIFEIFQIVCYSILYKLINKISKNLVNNYEFTNLLIYKKIEFKLIDNNISFQYQINSKEHSFNLLKNSSDVSVFNQVIFNQEYKYLVELLNLKNIKVETIFDCGANIGLTSIYLSSFYENSYIYAFEPATETFKRLENHIILNNISNVKLFKKGVWNKSTFLKADNTFRDGNDWSFRLVETEKKEEALFETISINEVLNQNNIKSIDILKIDIEGGEVDLFSTNYLDWLSKTKVIAIEIHDEFDCRIDIENKIKSAGFQLYHSGELTIGIIE